MISRIHLSTIIFLAAIIWGALLLVEGVAVQATWFRYFSIVVGVLLIVLLLFDTWLWRAQWLQEWFVRRPVLSGTWRVIIRSDWRDHSDFPIDPIIAFISVRQKYSSISLRLLTAESHSRALVADIFREADGTYVLSAIYRNEPRYSVRNDSEIHNGGMILRVIGSPVSKLEGHYWTDRGTAGEIEMVEHFPKIVDSYESAQVYLA